VIVVDSLTNATAARSLRADIRGVADRPIRFLINPHSDADRVWTSHLFTEATVICAHAGRRPDGGWDGKGRSNRTEPESGCLPGVARSFDTRFAGRPEHRKTVLRNATSPVALHKIGRGLTRWKARARNSLSLMPPGAFAASGPQRQGEPAG